MTNKKTQSTDIDTKAAVQALEYLLAAGFVSRKRLYIENFLRGIFFSVGSIIGATVVIALLVWLLSAFDTAPVIGHFLKTVQDAINSRN